jgi:hypothetical protein
MYPVLMATLQAGQDKVRGDTSTILPRVEWSWSWFSMFQ